MTAPRLYNSDISRWSSRVESLEGAVSRLERKVGDLEREANRAKFETARELTRQKDNLQLLVFAIVNAAVIALAIVSRR